MLLTAAVLGVLIAGGQLTGTWWWLAGALAGMGAFVVFEARSGWCAVRAMGFRTWV
jgi:DNA gyrase/topoisomerase IV subunit B